MLGRGILGAAALVAAGALVTLTGCATTSASVTTAGAAVKSGSAIVLGTHAPLSGPLGPQWTRITAATKSWFAYVNAHGGVDGRKIDYRVVDDKADPAVARTAVESLVEDDGALALIGNAGSDAHAAAAPYLTKHGVPDLFISSGDRAWNSADGAPNRFGFAPDTQIEAKVLATYLNTHFYGKTVCAVVESSTRGTDIVDGLQAVLGAKSLGAVQRFVVTDTDLHTQVAALQNAGCEVDVVGGADAQTAAALSAARDLGYTATWATPSLGGGIHTIQNLLGARAEYVNGLISTTALPISTDDPWVALFAQVNAQYGDGTPLDSDVIYGMSLGDTAVQALGNAGDRLSRTSLIAAMEDGRVPGNGLLPLSYSSFDHAPYQGVGVTVVTDGQQAIQDHQVMLGSSSGSRVVEYLGAPIALTGSGLPSR